MLMPPVISGLEIAAGLAQRFDTKLIGIAACEVKPPAYGRGAFATAILNELRPQTESKLKEAAARFRAGAEGKVREIEWRQAFAKPTAYVAQEGRAADLIITGAARDVSYIDPVYRARSGRPDHAGREACPDCAPRSRIPESQAYSGGVEGHTRGAPGRPRRCHCSRQLPT